MQSKAGTVTAYLAALPAKARSELEGLRNLIRRTAPELVECMQYGMPAYLHGDLLCSFAAQRNYLAFYLLDPEVVERNRALLGKLSTGKGCIRFHRFQELPVKTIQRMLMEAVRRRKASITSEPCDEPATQSRRRPTRGSS